LLVVALIWLGRALSSRFNRQLDAQDKLANSMDGIAERLQALEQSMRRRQNDLEGIRAEFSLRDSRAAPVQDYQDAITQASNGTDSASIAEQFGLCDDEAQLLVTVYGPKDRGKAKDQIEAG